MRASQILSGLIISSLILGAQATAFGQAASGARKATPAVKLRPAASTGAAKKAAGATAASRPAAAPSAPAQAPAAAPATAKPATAAAKKAAEAQKAAQEAAAKSAAEAAAQQQELQTKQQKLQRINKLRFDRRPSAILKAWSEPVEPDKKKEDGKEEDDKKEAKAKTATPAPAPASTSRSPVSSGLQAAPSLPPGVAFPPGAVLPSGVSPPTATTATTSTSSMAAELTAFDKELKQFQRAVTLSRWDEVEHYLNDLPEDLGKALYTKLITGLRSSPTGAPRSVSASQQSAFQQFQQMQAQQSGRMPEKNMFNFADVLALARVAPRKLTDADLVSLGIFVRLAYENGNVLDKLMVILKRIGEAPEHEQLLSKIQIAKLLFASGNSIEAGEFLPTLEEATKEKDHIALNLLTRFLLAKYAEEKESELLEQAWQVTQAVLAAEEIEKPEKEEALRRAVELAPKIEENLGKKWLAESFTNRPQRGMEIIASIGASASQALTTRASDPDYRLKGLDLQTTAVEALLTSSPELADQWKDSLTLLAANWLREADVAYRYDTSTSLGPIMQRDAYGNIFYFNEGRYMGRTSSNRIKSISTGEILEIQPSERWLAMIQDSMKPKFAMIFAQLYLKVAEDEKAFPHIEALAKLHPDMAQELVDEYLRVWTKNHDPNSANRRTNSYMYMYGFERRRQGIPLTRSKQERNLEELGELVARLRSLPLEKLNEQLLARAFTTCHSTAEVYRLEAIEKVFGSLENLEPKTMAEMSQQMRANLIGVWRQPAVQKDKGTKRKQKDIQAEVLRGYEVAKSVIEGGLKKYPDEWTLHLAKAALLHDENIYRKEIAPDSKFTERRGGAFDGFEKAVELYVAKLEQGEVKQEEETTKAFEIWFYASLGASDLNHVTDETTPDLKQPPKIKAALERLPGATAERHINMFANLLFTRMSAVKPAVKYRYLRNGFRIVGDNKRAKEARKVFDYYNDLVTEIKLETKIDGSDVVGHENPFGVFVNLRHTREIERESGGFGKYLQNQSTSTRYYYNYGRPLEDYRDKFEEVVRQAMKEHFEVISITFQTEDVNSKATEKYGWRVTPYAYLLLKARGPEVDKLPPVRLDLDFLDTSGYAVLPIESPTVPIDASAKKGDLRPLADLSLTQTLDERQADEGKLIVEVKATGHGLVPELEDVVEFKLDEFDVTEVDDQGLSVSRFDKDSEDSQILSERTWLVTMKAKEGLEELPKKFQFGEAKQETKEVVFQRYNDADLAEVEASVSLEQEYGEKSYAEFWIIGITVFGLLGLTVTWWSLRRRQPKTSQTGRYAMPENITPFTVLGLLRDIHENNGLSSERKDELLSSIHELERHYFIDKDADEPDLEGIAATWIRKSRV